MGQSARSSLAAAAVAVATLGGGCGPAEAPPEPGQPGGPALYRVGPGREYVSLRDVAFRLRPGDLVEVDGGATYEGGVVFGRSGTPEAPIVVRAAPGSASRPRIEGGEDTVTFSASHIVFEGFEVRGGAFRCVYHQGDSVTLRNVLVRECPGHGILAADKGSGSLELDGVEVTASGSGDSMHPIYVATDQIEFPRAVFRMRQSYVHDNPGGNGLKSRAERNEIHYNWFEGSAYYELDLVGPEEEETEVREDSDVVGNVFVSRSGGAVARIGGDGSGESRGRYRFAYNTFVVASAQGGAALRLQDGLESVELSNNCFASLAGAPLRIAFDDEALWTEGTPRYFGGGNWLPAAAEDVPAALEASPRGDDPRFSDAEALDLRPADGSPLVDASEPSAPPPDKAVPSALPSPEFLPPARALGPALARAAAGPLDVGAFERTAP